jgi:hypothetical protein
MPRQCSRVLFGYEVVEGRRVVAAFDGGEVTSDAGALPLSVTDWAIGLVTRFAACFADGRAQAQLEHSTEGMVTRRVCGIALGYACPRPGPAGSVGGSDRSRRAAPRPGKSTLNRSSTRPSAARAITSSAAIPKRSGVFVELLLEAHRTPPKRIMLDLDATEDPLHGHQEGRFFHNYGACPPAAQGPTGGLLLLPVALRVLRQAPVRGPAAVLEHRRLSGRGRRGGAHRLPDPSALAQGNREPEFS